MVKYISILLSFLCFLSCKKDTISTYDVGYEYYPIKPGYAWIYQVDSIVYDDFFNDTIPYSFQLKDYVDSSFTDNEGEEAYKIIRFTRKTSTDLWEIRKVLTIKKTKINLQYVEDNTRFIKLIFPVKNNASWNGNAYNDSLLQNYKYKNVNTSLMLGNMPFDSTLTVILKDKSDVIEKKSSKEQYAKHIGMIYKEIIDISYQSKKTPPLYPGFEYYQTLISYKKDTP